MAKVFQSRNSAEYPGILHRRAWKWICTGRHCVGFSPLAAVSAAWAVARLAAAEPPNYGAVRDFLVAHTNVVELTGENGERVAICPEYQGRVMTSTSGDLTGRSFGWVNKSFIEKGEADRHFNNFGGEDRLWLGPEGGPYSLWFAPGAEQKLSNWITPPALNDGAFKITSDKEEPYYRLARQMKFTNAAKHAVRPGSHPRNPPAKGPSLRQAVRRRRPKRLVRRQAEDGRLSDDQHDHQSRCRP